MTVRVKIKSAVHTLEMVDWDKMVKVKGDQDSNPIRWLGAFEVYGSPWDREVDMIHIINGPDDMVIVLVQEDYDQLVEECC